MIFTNSTCSLMNNIWRMSVFHLHCEESTKIILDFGVLIENLGMKCIFQRFNIIRSKITENNKVPEKELTFNGDNP